MSHSSFDPRNVQALLYDFDGTLADSFRPIRLSFNHMLRQLGVDRELSADETLDLVGGPLEESVARLLPPSQVFLGTSIFRNHYKTIFLPLTHPMPGASVLLETMAMKGIRQGVITNKLGSSARELVRHFGWTRLLPICIGEGDGLPLKPDPAMILSVSEEMGLNVEQILFVGDSPFDFQAARKAGCRICLVTTGTHRHAELSLLGPDLLMNNLDDLGEWFTEPDRVL